MKVQTLIRPKPISTLPEIGKCFIEYSYLIEGDAYDRNDRWSPPIVSAMSIYDYEQRRKEGNIIGIAWSYSSSFKTKKR